MKESKPCIAGLDGITERWSGGGVFILTPKLYLIGFRIPFERHDQTITLTLVELSQHWGPGSAWHVALVSTPYHHGTTKNTITTIHSTVHHVELKPMTSAWLRGSGRR